MSAKHHLLIHSFLVTALVCAAAWAGPVLRVGQSAPDFSLPDSQGQVHRLSGSKGKIVVLEWFNDKCPFVRKHYDTGNMQSLQAKYTARDVIWYSILSSAPGKEGYADAKEAQREKEANHSRATALLLDPDGTVGKAYGAKNTPVMFVIGKDGKILYQGAIDDKPTTDDEDVKGARNYVAEALEAALAGKTVAVTETKPYGCGVKYR